MKSTHWIPLFITLFTLLLYILFLAYRWPSILDLIKAMWISSLLTSSFTLLELGLGYCDMSRHFLNGALCTFITQVVLVQVRIPPCSRHHNWPLIYSTTPLSRSCWKFDTRAWLAYDAPRSFMGFFSTVQALLIAALIWRFTCCREDLIFGIPVSFTAIIIHTQGCVKTWLGYCTAS